jgi:hypothetical protein
LQSGGEGFMHGLFGEIQISEETHECRQNPARFRSVKILNGSAELFGHRQRHLRQTSKTDWLDTTALGLPLPTIQWPATALIEGLQRGNSIGARNGLIAINPRIAVVDLEVDTSAQVFCVELS